MKKLLIGVAGGITVLLVVLAARAAMFSPVPVSTPPAQDFSVDRDAVAGRLGAAIQIPTISTSSAPYINAAALAELRGLVERSFPLVHERIERELINEHALLYTWKGSSSDAAPILLMAHQDVVPVIAGTAGDWAQPPYSGAVADGFIWGRGALDVKSGMMGILEAAELLLRRDFRPTRTIYFAFGHDEEIGGKLGAQKIAAHLEAQGVKLDMVLDEGGVVTRGLIPGVDASVALVGVAEKGYVSLELTVEAEGGHSSMPPEHTAVGVLSRAITRIEDNPFPAKLEHSQRFFNIVARKMPFGQRVIFANLWLFSPLVEKILSAQRPMNASLRTTAAATMFDAGVKDNVLPIKASAVVNFRIIPGDTVDSVMAYVTKVVDDPSVKIAPRGDSDDKAFGSNPSSVSPYDTESYERVARSIRQVSGEDDLLVAPYLVVGATDSRHYKGLSSNIYRFLFNRIGPDDVKRIHGTNERISVDNYEQTVRFYAQLMHNWSAP